MDKKNLLGKVLIRVGIGIVAITAVIFIPACTPAYWNGWLWCLILYLPMTGLMIFFYHKAPDLLERRMKMHETRGSQPLLIKLSFLFYIISFIVPGLDYRFGWSQVPFWLVLVSAAVVLAGYAVVAVAMVQNHYASRVLEISSGQKVIDTGLYSLVRHPMYLGALILYAFSPLVLGSWYALVPTVYLPIALVVRIRDEEKMLKNELPGYEDYTRRVKYRMIPGIW